MAPVEPEESITVEVPTEINTSTQSLLSRGGSGYESIYGSFFGSHFSLTDGSGIYISSLALTILLSIIVVVAIVLVTVVITLSVMLSACENKNQSSVNFDGSKIDSVCLSYQLNVELNNLQGQAVPLECSQKISEYVHGGQYLNDFKAVVDLARRYLNGLVVDNSKNHTIVLDIDETALSNFLYSSRRIETYMDLIFVPPMEKFESFPMVPLLDLYSELLAANWNIVFLSERPASAWNATAQNLVAAGYKSWVFLILRSDDEAGMTAQEYKSSKRVQLEKQGYEIKAVLGDQWSDITGPATGARTFKLPNLIYQIF
eukprot:c15245_g1_i2 orf=484-1431(+)